MHLKCLDINCAMSHILRPANVFSVYIPPADFPQERKVPLLLLLHGAMCRDSRRGTGNGGPLGLHRGPLTSSPKTIARTPAALGSASRDRLAFLLLQARGEGPTRLARRLETQPAGCKQRANCAFTLPGRVWTGAQRCVGPRGKNICPPARSVDLFKTTGERLAWVFSPSRLMLRRS